MTEAFSEFSVRLYRENDPKISKISNFAVAQKNHGKCLNFDFSDHFVIFKAQKEFTRPWLWVKIYPPRQLSVCLGNPADGT